MTGSGSEEPRLAVYTGPAEQLDDDRLPVVGRLTADGGVVRWRPSYRLAAGQSYTAVWSRDDSEPLLRTFNTPPDDRDATTVVSEVYPAVATVPENLLRLYVQFSAPMSRGRAHEFLELLDTAGHPVRGAFVVPEQELWSPQGDRLTLFFDPGRLKQDVGPNLEMGAPLRAGQTITLRVSADWPDGDGAPLVEDFATSWTIGPADRSRPEPSEWTVSAPATPEAAVELWLSEALDHPLAERLVTVESSGGERIDGVAMLSDNDRRWRFSPADPWAPGAYVLRVDPALEDLAGNSLSRLFDEPLVGERVGTPATAAVRLPFEVGAAARR